MIVPLSCPLSLTLSRKGRGNVAAIALYHWRRGDFVARCRLCFSPLRKGRGNVAAP